MLDMKLKYSKESLSDVQLIAHSEQDTFGVPTPSVLELSDKYQVTTQQVMIELFKGIAIEYEHTNCEIQASEIARDHLGEDLYYYDKLAAVENNVKLI